MASLQVDVVVGIALGVLLGVAPAVLAMATGAFVGSSDERELPRLAVVGPGVIVAAISGVATGLVGLSTAGAVRLAAALVVVGLLTAYGFSRGLALAGSMSRDRRREVERGAPLSETALDAVDASGQVAIAATGEIRSLDGYPSLSDSLEAEIAAARFRLPADLPIDELEARIERQLTERFDLAAVTVSVDARGRATIRAAPPISGVARHVPDGHRAVTVCTLVPTGLVRGEDVLVEAGGRSIQGTVLDTASQRHDALETGVEDSRDVSVPAPDLGAPQGSDDVALDRVTVAVPTASADALLESADATVAVRSRDTRADFRAFALLEAVDKGVRYAILDDGLLDAVRSDEPEPTLLAARPDQAEAWAFDPSPSDVSTGWEAYLVGDRTALEERLDADGATPEVIEA